MERKPNFIIPGAAKAGTTSIFYYLIQHPDVYVPSKKECRFFSQMPGDFAGPGDESVNNSIVRSLGEYMSLFSDASSEKALGDISPDYLYYYNTTIDNIKKSLDSPKIIIILRNPAERALSQYSHFLRDGMETLTFERALEMEEERKERNWQWAWRYKEIGFYYNQVKAYMDNFPVVRVYLYDDLRRDALGFMKDLYEFIGVDTSFTPDVSANHNASGIPGNKAMHEFITDYDHPIKKFLRPILLNTIGKENTEKLVNFVKRKNALKLKPRTRERLIEIYRDDILKLERLIERDLSGWLR